MCFSPHVGFQYHLHPRRTRETWFYHVITSPCLMASQLTLQNVPPLKKEWFNSRPYQEKPMVNTLPETNIAPEIHGWNTTFLLGWPIFRCYVSFREGKPWSLGLAMSGGGVTLGRLTSHFHVWLLLTLQICQQKHGFFWLVSVRFGTFKRS